jgi:hypothetical protein
LPDTLPLSAFPNVIHRHYKALVKEADAKEFQTSVKPAFWSGDDRNLKPRFFAQMKPQPSA